MGISSWFRTTVVRALGDDRSVPATVIHVTGLADWRTARPHAAVALEHVGGNGAACEPSDLSLDKFTGMLDLATQLGELPQFRINGPS